MLQSQTAPATFAISWFETAFNQRLSAALSLAERPLGLSLTSTFSGVITFLRSGSQWAFSAVFVSFRRPCFLGPKCCWSKLARSCPPRKRLTSLSSSEWKVITQRRPPGRSASLAARSPAWSSFSSSFTKMRKAWKVLVAAWAGRLSRSLRVYATAAGSDPGDKEMARIRILNQFESGILSLLDTARLLYKRSLSFSPSPSAEEGSCSKVSWGEAMVDVCWRAAEAGDSGGEACRDRLRLSAESTFTSNFKHWSRQGLREPFPPGIH